MRRPPGPVLAAHRFVPGERDDAPLLVPLAARGRDAREIAAFCRRICPGASILAPRLDPDDPSGAQAPQRLARLIQRVGLLYDLTLMPVVLVTQGQAADLAVQVALLCAAHVAACILLRPAGSVAALPAGGLAGLSVLLACAVEADGTDRAGLAMQSLLATAGADVIAVRVSRRHAPGGSDVAVCRVFLEALFPTGDGGGASG